MPGGDRTGPRGEGPLTGRGAGYGAGYNMPGYMNPIPGGGGGFYGAGRGRLPWGGGRGRSWGGGRGMGRWQDQTVPYPIPAAPNRFADQEIAELKAQAGYLTSTLAEIEKRLDELNKSGKEKEA